MSSLAVQGRERECAWERAWAEVEGQKARVSFSLRGPQRGSHPGTLCFGGQTVTKGGCHTALAKATLDHKDLTHILGLKMDISVQTLGQLLGPGSAPFNNYALVPYTHTRTLLCLTLQS